MIPRIPNDEVLSYGEEAVKKPSGAAVEDKVTDYGIRLAKAPAVKKKKAIQKKIKTQCFEENGICFYTYEEEEEDNKKLIIKVKNETFDYVNLKAVIKMDNMIPADKNVKFTRVDDDIEGKFNQCNITLLLGPGAGKEETLLFGAVVEKQKQPYAITVDPVIVFGNPSASHDPKVKYKLPFKGEFKAVRVFDDGDTHKGDMKFAVDFNMPQGTDIRAARSGIVVKVKKDSTVVGSRDISDMKNANFIRIRHSDATYGRYLHLKTDGAKVKVGQNIKAGTVIGKSGNTGYSEGAHLHFDVLVATEAGSYRTVPFQFEIDNGQPEKDKLYKNN